MSAEVLEHVVPARIQELLRSNEFGHYIDGSVVSSLDGATMPVLDPATGQEITRAALGSEADVDRAVRAARDSFEDGRWRFLAPLERERRLRRLTSMLAEQAGEIAELDIVDAGLLRGHTTALIEMAIDSIDYYSGWPTKMDGVIPPVPEGMAVYLQREPMGVVGFITPWNAPSFFFGVAMAAVAAGNSIVIKPAEQTPLSIVRLAATAVEAGIPPGVFNVVQGLGETVGAAMVAHADIDAISFTGSVETGRRIQAGSASNLKRVSLELGGKSPFIIFPDADLDMAVATAMSGVWNGAGQICTAGSRVMVHQDIYDDVVARIVEGSSAIRIGSGFNPDSQLPPLVSAEQLSRVSSYVDIAVAEGAVPALKGGRVGTAGYFHEPVVFTDVENSMRIAQEEVFGPVMTVLCFSSEEEAVQIANDTNYGLTAGVWTSNLSISHRMSKKLKAGTVWVNGYQQNQVNVPYGGVKLSGHGRTLGAAALDDFTHVKSIWMNLDHS